MNNQEFDHIIKEHFLQREIEVSADAWNKLGVASTVKQQKIKPIWYRVAAAVVLLGFGFSYVFFTNKQTEEVVEIDSMNIKKELSSPVDIIEVAEKSKRKNQIQNKSDFEKNGIAITNTKQIEPKTKGPISTQKHTESIVSQNATDATKTKQMQLNAFVPLPEHTERNDSLVKESTTQIASLDKSILEDEKDNAIKKEKDFDVKIALHIDIAAVVKKKAYKIDAQSLLQEVENDIFDEKDKRFREKVITVLTEGVNNVSLALEND